MPKEQETGALAKRYAIPELLASILIKRGIRTPEEVYNFLHPSMACLHDPYRMHAMDEAVNRLVLACTQGQKMMIYGDFDVDGVTAVSLYVNFFTALVNKAILPTLSVVYHLPSRKTEGYGVSEKGVLRAYEEGCDLMIVLDCGIKDLKNLALAHEKGIDVIVCDHHEPGEMLPKNAIILNPKKKACTYPFKGLTGCGIGFKLLFALCRALSIPKTHAENYLGLVALSTLADMVPLVDENRVLVAIGVEKIRQESSLLGLEVLIKTAYKRKEDIRAADLGFTVCPKINAAGRMEHAKLAVACLTTSDEEAANHYAKKLHALNNLRREETQKVTEAACMQFAQAPCMIAHGETWEQGVLGIVAARCTEHYHTPAIILSGSGTLVGSARSVEGVDIHRALDRCAKWLIRYGGHPMAAGLTLAAENLGSFTEEMQRIVRPLLVQNTHPFAARYLVTEVIDLSMVNQSLLDCLQSLSPFGRGNEDPLFLSTNVTIGRPPTLLRAQHLKFYVQRKNNEPLACIFFRKGAYYKDILRPGLPFHMVYSVAEDNYHTQKIVLHVRDIQWD